MFDLIIPYWPQIKLALIAAAALSLVAGGWTARGYVDGAAIAAQKIEAAETLAKEVKAKDATEHDLAQQSFKLELKHAQAQSALDDLHTRVTDSLGGLRRAGFGPSGTCPMPKAATTTPIDPVTPAGGWIVPEGAPAKFGSEAFRGDKLTEQLRTCQAYVVDLQTRFGFEAAAK
jgi:hypothetical protein